MTETDTQILTAAQWETLQRSYLHRTGKQSLVLAVSSSDLRRIIEEKFVEEQLQRTFARNLLWGLVTMNIVPQDLVFGPDEKPTIDSQLNEGQSLRLSTGADAPKCRNDVKWEGNLAESIDRIERRDGTRTPQSSGRLNRQGTESGMNICVYHSATLLRSVIEDLEKQTCG